MLLILLFLIFLIFLIYSYFKFNKDIIHPCTIFFFVYTLSIACAIYNIKAWNIELAPLTFGILLVGGLEFLIISILFNRKQKKEEQKNDTMKEIKIDIWKILLVILYELIVLVLVYLEVRRIASDFGAFHSFSEMLKIFKANTSYASNAQITRIVQLLQKPVYIFPYLFGYFFVYNFVASDEKIFTKIKKYWLLLIPIICFILQELLTSQRLSILALVFAIFTMYLICWNRKRKWLASVSLKTLGKLLVVACIGLIMFYYSASLIGRVNKKNMFDYITLYVGGSIECLNQFVKNPPASSEIIGKETFHYFIKNLDSYGIVKINEPLSLHSEFRYYKGNMIGNVYTAYRRWIYDFGLIGAFILQGIVAVFYNLGYIIIKQRKIKKDDLFIIIFCYLIYGLYLHPIDSYLFLATIKLAFVTNLVLFFFLYFFLRTEKISIKYLKKRKETL